MKLYHISFAILIIVLLATTAVAGPLARLYINPGHVILCTGAKQQFTVYGTDSDDNVVPVTGTVTWTRNATAGTITSDGLFTASGTPGLYTDAVKAKVGDITAVAIIRIVPITTVGGGRYAFERSWGQYSPGRMIRPASCTVDSADNVYVVDISASNVQKFDNTGRFQSIIDLKIKSDIHYVYMAWAHEDYIYLSDCYSIFKLDQSGNLIGRWGTFGSGNGQFNSACGLVTDQNGNLYVADSGNDRIQKFDSAGHFISKWGTQGTENGQFDSPVSIAIDSNRYLYIADYMNNRIQKFDSDGNYIAQWGKNGSGGAVDSSSWHPRFVAVDKNNVLYVGEDYTNSIRKFDSSGAFISDLPIIDPSYCEGFALDSAGNIYIAGYHVTKTDPSGNYLCRWGSVQDDTLNMPMSVACNRHGTIYVAGDPAFGDRYAGVVMFDHSGTTLGCLPDIFPQALANAVDGNVYFVYPDQVEAYDSSGSLINRWNDGGDNAAVSAVGNLYVLNGCQVSEYDPAGHLLARWQTSLSTNSWWHRNGIAVDEEGNIYITDYSGGCILVYDALGNLLSKWGSEGSGDGQVWYPDSIVLTPDGLVVIGEFGNDRLHIFDRQGNSIAKWGNTGPDHTEFYGPLVSMGLAGELLVADSLNNRITKYIPVAKSANALKQAKDGAIIAVSGLVSTASTLEIGDGFYAEMYDRSSGIKITKKSASRGKNIVAVGVMATVNGERELQASALSYTLGTVPEPLALTNKSLGGGDFSFDSDTGAGQRGVEDGVGLNNIGLLVKTTGVVTVVGNDFFYIDDGTRARDGSIFCGIRVKCGIMNKPAVGQQVAVTGISSISKIGDRYFRSIRPRISSDIAPIP